MSIFEYDEEKHRKTIYEEALVHTLKRFCNDFETVYQNVITNTAYTDVTEEQVKK